MCLAKEELEASALEFHCMHIEVLPDSAQLGGKSAHVDVVEKALLGKHGQENICESRLPSDLLTKSGFTPRSVLESGLSLETQKTCLCCLEDFQPTSRVAVLPCGHVFDEETGGT